MTKPAWKYWEPKFQADKVCDMNPVWPWGGHRRFAYDLVRWMRPGRIAELGVHWGTSFFTFAQAMKDGRMKDTELIGVDTFEGEEHAGKYGSEVLDTVRRIVKSSFPRQSITLHKMFFADALPVVEDESVDLIHIDGLHTFEAVKEDFETWLPKLAPDGVMLFHDVAPDTGYGSTEYWNQLSKRHPSFAFEHSWGLGVLFPKGGSRFEALEALGLADKLVAYPAIARAERAAIEVRDLGKMAEDRMATIQKQSAQHAEMREKLRELRGSTAPREELDRAKARAAAAEKLAAERSDAIRQQSDKIRVRDERLAKLQGDIASARELAESRLETIQKQADLVRQRDETVAASRERIEGLRENVASLDKRLAVAKAARDEMAKRIQALEARARDASEREARARESLAAAKTQAEQLRAQSRLAEETRAYRSLLADMATHVSALATSHEKDRRQAAERFEALGEAIERARAGSEAAAKAFRERLALLDVDADLQSLRSEHLEAIVSGQRAQLERLGGGDRGEADWLTGERQ
ncbi:MAG: class I SAM-dependent methyltransferase [Phycisphaerales bacterium JB041]